MRKTKGRLDELINYKSRPFTIQEQKAELLLRNAVFQKDRAQVQIHFAYQKRADDIVRASDKKKVKDVTEAELYLGSRDRTAGNKWFYEKWDVATSWDGQEVTLHQHIRVGPGLWGFRPVELMAKPHARDGIPVEFRRYQQALPLNGPVMFITVDPWTTKESIRQQCRYLNQLKTKLFGFSAESKRSSAFARDLCWYDLKKEHGFTFTQIATGWAKRRPDELKAMVPRTSGWKNTAKEYRDLAVIDEYIKSGLSQAIRAAVERLQKGINYLTR
ncbi:MAG: hypothetical protein ABSG19_14580 [Candidatus Aminicenantales bacterium]